MTNSFPWTQPVALGDMHSFLAAMSTFINEMPKIANHNYFVYLSQVYSFEAANHKLNPAFKRNLFARASNEPYKMYYIYMQSHAAHMPIG